MSEAQGLEMLGPMGLEGGCGPQDLCGCWPEPPRTAMASGVQGEA